MDTFTEEDNYCTMDDEFREDSNAHIVRAPRGRFLKATRKAVSFRKAILVSPKVQGTGKLFLPRNLQRMCFT